MKIILISVLFLLILSAGCSAGDTVIQPVQTVGGYNEISTSEEIVSETVAYLHDYFITDEIYKGLVITDVEKAYSQVVAGRNIKLICNAEKGEKTQKWEFVVFIDLQNKFNFTKGTLLETLSMPGGYTEISTDDKDVKDTVDYLNEYLAKTEEYKNIKISNVEKAFSQVVAGRNIKLLCKVKNNENTESWQFIVFIDLQNKFNFTEGKKL